MVDLSETLRRVLDCPPGDEYWPEFESACLDALIYLLVPPLSPPRRQARTLSGTNRRDAAFPNRVIQGGGHWARFYAELAAKMIMVDFKNYDRTALDASDVDQMRGYLNLATGRLGILVCSKAPTQSAKIRRNTVFREDGKIVLFLQPSHIKEMFAIKERGDDPSDLIADLVDEFRLEYE